MCFFKDTQFSRIGRRQVLIQKKCAIGGNLSRKSLLCPPKIAWPDSIFQSHLAQDSLAHLHDEE
jgi:hypothetical protein